MKTWPEGSGYKLDQWRNFYAQWIERVRALPGVKSAAYAGLPIRDHGYEPEIEVPGSLVPPNGPAALLHGIGSQFFATFGIPLLRGRDFNAQDSVGDNDALKVVIVNDSFARYFFGDKNPLGKRLSVGPFKNLEIVGVVGNAKLESLDASDLKLGRRS
jgi:hypothetical protein